MSGDKLNSTHKEWHRRKARWKHNSFFGHAAMMQANARSILNSPTTTEEAKAIAVRIEHDATVLREALKTRVDSK